MNHDKFQKNLKKKSFIKIPIKTSKMGKYRKNCQFKKGECAIRGNVIFVLIFF